ncbi:trans-aconitate 2-methyltransferase [Gaeumannomyces tritici R3-111a-1]|uniref:Trans-aconitate 2-methyltransferase n=1 Tax=Gaeumannomyces tritici (strain R3-111a-1) TaxID=644352 RepID=J3NYW8_GAET3|nr:trans-aconitate 2-methyltransferase [Gaeumannomyces tritici R3-111a-1]EJT76551.1 trans-aconitate 2-methyltransferase [Gaeumannomyces tritici R3-111a-1]
MTSSTLGRLHPALHHSSPRSAIRWEAPFGRRPFHAAAARTMSTSQGSAPQGATAPAGQADWSASQYLKFHAQRTRPVHDLVAQLPSPPIPASGARVVDLGCGPGNSTAVLRARFPDARISGLDSSPDMVARARAQPSMRDGPAAVDFHQADLLSWSPDQLPVGGGGGGGGDRHQPVHLFFSNAVLHWLRRHDRVPTIVRLVRTQAPGGVFAFQCPDNWAEPSHAAMREVALRPGRPWSAAFAAHPPSRPGEGESGDPERPDMDAIESPEDMYNALIPHCASVDVWKTTYQHVLPGPREIVEWVKGTGLMPFLNRIPEQGGAREAFLSAYKERLAELYPPLADGQVTLRYPRLFVIAVRK